MGISGPSSYDSEDDDGGVFSEINITPLTDVFLVLLIIFMVTSSAITQSSIKINLPKAGAASSAQKKTGVRISLNSAGSIFVDEKEVQLSDLEAVLRTKIAETENKTVILSGDQEALLGPALKVMNVAKLAGATRFAIATKNKAKAESN